MSRYWVLLALVTTVACGDSTGPDADRLPDMTGTWRLGFTTLGSEDGPARCELRFGIIRLVREESTARRDHYTGSVNLQFDCTGADGDDGFHLVEHDELRGTTGYGCLAYCPDYVTTTLEMGQVHFKGRLGFDEQSVSGDLELRLSDGLVVETGWAGLQRIQPSG